MLDLEVCVESLAEAEVASKAKVKRIELCSGLEVGGLTPSLGLIEKCSQLDSVETHVLIRPRSGDFFYSDGELSIMKADIEMSAKMQAQGVVFGALQDDRVLNERANNELVQLSKSLGLETTFHRAFDVAADPEKVLNQLIKLGFDRLLTSGQAASAIDGVKTIKQLVDVAKGRIQIMAGGGVSPDNAKELVNAGIRALHFSIRKPVQRESYQMGSTYAPDIEKLIGIGSSIMP